MYASKYFNLGEVVVSSRVNELLKENKRFSLEIIVDLQRYCIKGWGDLSEADKEINNDALNNIAEVSKEDEDRQEEIIFTSYLYDKDSPIEYVIKEQEKIKNIHINLQKAMDRHDIEGCFKAHEAIHDYDYWIINYPAYFDTFPATDWGGVDVYFGNIQ